MVSIVHTGSKTISSGDIGPATSAAAGSDPFAIRLVRGTFSRATSVLLLLSPKSNMQSEKFGDGALFVEKIIPHH
jgi:hypothetical protein